MKNFSSRPGHLPDFGAPPLNEVVLGVQFAPPLGYSQILAFKVWELFRNEYPVVQELPAIQPAFETFGLSPPGVQGPQFNFGIITGAAHDRFWFLRETQDELIQFQHDRLLHNWRKVGDQSNEYPRFEAMANRFQTDLLRLEEFAATLSPQTLAINQCEISYINQISIGAPSALNAQDWLRFIKFDTSLAEDFSGSFREILKRNDGTPRGRLICDASTGYRPTGEKIIQLTLTVRGAPNSSSISDAMDFLSQGRELIVNKFTAITTDDAHSRWARTK